MSENCPEARLLHADIRIPGLLKANDRWKSPTRPLQTAGGRGHKRGETGCHKASFRAHLSSDVECDTESWHEKRGFVQLATGQGRGHKVSFCGVAQRRGQKVPFHVQVGLCIQGDRLLGTTASGISSRVLDVEQRRPGGR